MKDEGGKWHFSDKPPPDENKAEIVGGGKARGKSKAPVSSDIAAALEDKIEPRSPIERVAMAVVSIKTPLVTGSGFFVTDDGYLLTNRHVVRPTMSAGWKAADESI